MIGRIMTIPISSIPAGSGDDQRVECEVSPVGVTRPGLLEISGTGIVEKGCGSNGDDILASCQISMPYIRPLIPGCDEEKCPSTTTATARDVHCGKYDVAGDKVPKAGADDIGPAKKNGKVPCSEVVDTG
jgi:hypothetical protein